MNLYEKLKKQILCEDEKRARYVMTQLTRNNIYVYQDKIITIEELNEAIS